MRQHDTRIAAPDHKSIADMTFAEASRFATSSSATVRQAFEHMGEIVATRECQKEFRAVMTAWENPQSVKVAA